MALPLRTGFSLNPRVLSLIVDYGVLSDVCFFSPVQLYESNIGTPTAVAELFERGLERPVAESNDPIAKPGAEVIGYLQCINGSDA
ncbi:hypothetical protein [Corynebacterium amycolatum]|uniref:hypothetical protein n=1 Tax=Corynebacterium amycolatum TaxID=43765 RepID=UPI00223AA0BC|nr:hypothetical protein [Corynebacterium amycolatum]MCT1548811.1 hypothetical protein [Corynebacterium amycolatum]